MCQPQQSPRSERSRTLVARAVLLAPLMLIAIDAGATTDARERISCTARHGCLFGKDSRKPIAGWTCHSRHSHARSYFFCTPGANG